MASITLNTYDADVHVTSFMGLQQYGDPVSRDLRYSDEAYNAETPGGVLQPVAAPTQLTATLAAPCETLAAVYRRWYSGTDNKTLLVAAAAGKLYSMPEGGSSWTELAFPSGVTAYSCDKWSWVTYEVNVEGSDPQDVLLLSNHLDGMIMVNGITLAVTKVTTPKKFGVIARYAERIWGGAIDEDPDMLVYSAPYDPTDWDANPTIPEDGAGDIQQPSWDGDSFTQLLPFGAQLIAFKRTRVWRVLGTDPGEYTFKEQYGGGTPYPRTAAVDTDNIWVLDKDGMSLYDGSATSAYGRAYATDIWENMNQAQLDKAVGCLWRDKYFLSLPVGTSTTNNRVVIYDKNDGTWLERRDLSVNAFLPTEDCLYFTSDETPGKIWQWNTDSWAGGTAVSGLHWATPWTDLGTKRRAKDGLELYLTVEAKAATTLTFTLETDKKTKVKTVTFPAAEGVGAKQKRVRLPGHGRQFRLKIVSTGSTRWRIVGGLHMVVETDTD